VVLSEGVTVNSEYNSIKPPTEQTTVLIQLVICVIIPRVKKVTTLRKSILGFRRSEGLEIITLIDLGKVSRSKFLKIFSQHVFET